MSFSHEATVRMPSSKMKGQPKSIWLRREIISKLKKPPTPTTPNLMWLFSNIEEYVFKADNKDYSPTGNTTSNYHKKYVVFCLLTPVV